jgi:hypothetical protein
VNDHVLIFDGQACRETERVAEPGGEEFGDSCEVVRDEGSKGEEVEAGQGRARQREDGGPAIKVSKAIMIALRAIGLTRNRIQTIRPNLQR